MMYINPEYHKMLNPKLWDGMHLKEEVKDKLLEIVDAFIDYCELPVTIKQVNLVGSNAGFTWTSKSDIDINVIIDTSKFKDKNLASDYFDIKKKVFKRDHSINIYSIPVEITVTEKEDEANTSGAYSLKEDKWLVAPVYNPPEFDQKKASKIATNWKDKIIDVVYDKKSDADDLDELKKKIKKQRHEALKKDGEVTPVNFAYKEIRKRGYIDLLKAQQKKKLTKQLSLKEEVYVDLPEGIFVKVLPTTESMVKLRDYFKPLENFRPLQEDLHCTVIYSKHSARNICLPHVSKSERFYAKGTDLIYWENGEGNIVLGLDSPSISDLNEKFKKAGITPSFPLYCPHITLIHPITEQEIFDNKELFDDMSELLQNNPLELELYYGGYTLIDDNGN